ncbi:MAG: signal peptidase I [Clostridium beijerinckii]
MNKNNTKVLNLGSMIIDKSKKNSENKSIGKNKENLFKEWVIPIALAIILALLINKFIFFNILIPTPSMVPTLNVKDRFVVTRMYNMGNLKEGDIIVFYSDEYKERMAKRLIGLPGDKIEIKDGVVFRNGEKIEEEYVKNKDKYNGTYEVPQGKYFFLGDNRPISADSRRWKNPYIDASDIEGKVQFRFYPLKDLGVVK